MDNNKATGLIITLATGVIFGCPGLFLMAFSIIALLPDPSNPLSTGGIQVGIVGLLFGVILVIIPIAVGYFALRTKPEVPANNNQPFPPDS